MLTVVAKLLHLTSPDLAFFGQKDAQQLALIRRMVRDLNFPVEIVGVETVREDDGLALSSRNRYLSAGERRTALALSRALFAGRERLAAQEALRARAAALPGVRDRAENRAEALSRLGEARAAADAHAVAQAAECAGAGAVRAAARAVLDEAAKAEPPLTLDYLALVDPADFTEVPDDHQGEAVSPSPRAWGARGSSTTSPGPRSRHVTGIRLHAPEPGWAIDADVVVVGSGVAGLTAALRCTAAGLRTVVVTKARLDDGSTRWAQGGIAAALGEGDTPSSTSTTPSSRAPGSATSGPCGPWSPRAPTPSAALIETGADFDKTSEGEIALTREGGHHRRRIAHAGGDATGAEISRALVEAIRDRGVRTVEHALVLDLLTDAGGARPA